MPTWVPGEPGASAVSDTCRTIRESTARSGGRMPDIAKSFTVESPPEQTWEYMTDMENFSSHLPGFVDYEEEDEVTSYWTVKIDLSMFSKELTFEVDVLETEYPHAAFTLDPIDQPADGEGAVDFKPDGDGGTEVELTVQSEASGRMAPFLNKVIGNALDTVSDEFVANLEEAPLMQSGEPTDVPDRLDAYHFYEDEWDSYEQLYESFEWAVPDEFNLAEYICDRWAQDDPDDVALYVENPNGERTQYTYGELQTYSMQLANAFEELGISRGDRIALTAPQGVETLLTNIAAWRLGAVSVPLAPQFGPDALEYRVNDCEASVCVVDADNVATIDAVRDDIPSLEHVLVMEDEAATDDSHGFWETLEDCDETFETVTTAADEDAVIVYTSGTTGDPKGVRTPHQLHLGILPGFVTIHCNMEIDDDTVWRTPAGWGWMVFFVGIASLFYGTAMVASPGRYDPETELRLIEEYDVTNWFAPPTVIRMMMQVEDAAQYDVGSVRAIPTGGEAVGQSIIDWAEDTFGNVTVNEAYGQSEALLTVGECGALLESREGKMGRAVPGHEVDVVDKDTAEPLEPGAVGELAVRHEGNPVIFNGYWNMPEKTDSKFANGWLLTEDLGIKDDEYFAFHSRKDDVIICSGYRVSPEELEEKLSTHEAVADAGVIGIPDDTRGKVPKAFVTLASDSEGSASLQERLQEYIKDRLAPYEYPREIEFIPELPTTPVSGKIQRAELEKREGITDGGQ